MSSNAFARSRPRVRHQRVPKTQCYAHPRFLKLVKELVRIDEAKKKREELDHNDCSSSNSARDTCINSGDDSRDGGEDCSNTTGSSAQQMMAQQNIHHNHNNHHHHHHHHHHHSHNHNHNHNHNHQQHQQQHQQQQSSLAECCPLSAGLASTNYCSVISEAHSSNGYRSLECSHSASALHDNYYRHNSNSDNQQQFTPHDIHHQNFHHHNHHQRHYNYPSNHQESFTQINNSNNLHHPHQDYRCSNKCSSSSSATTISIDHSKTGLIEYNNINLSNVGTDPDPRQDENRSKRKRSANDPLSTAKKTNPPSISPSSCSKRLKSSPEPARPLSPSFTKCPICLLDCMDRDPAFTNTCFHLFCFACVENWSKSKATCPLCRTKFNKIIYNIRSESCFDEKIASPIRRDDDDDRHIYEQIQLTANSISQSRTPNVDETRQIFDNFRSNNDVLMPHFAFNQIDPRQVDTLHSFNSVTNNSNFNSSVPHTPFASANYNPVGSNYIALIPSNSRLPPTSTGPAITSAYTTNSLTNISSEARLRIPGIPRLSRSRRYNHAGYDLSALESSLRSRSTSTNLNPSEITLESQHHNQIQHSSHHQHHNHHINQQQQHRSTGTMELGAGRGSRGIEHQHIHIPYPIPPRHYTNPNVYSRRPYTNPPIEQHILDNLYRPMPDM